MKALYKTFIELYGLSLHLSFPNIDFLAHYTCSGGKVFTTSADYRGTVSIDKKHATGLSESLELLKYVVTRTLS